MKLVTGINIPETFLPNQPIELYPISYDGYTMVNFKVFDGNDKLIYQSSNEDTARYIANITSNLKVEIQYLQNFDTITLLINELFLGVGDTAYLDFITEPMYYDLSNFTFTSSNPAYASVNENGMITTYEAGNGKDVTITVSTANGLTLSCQVYIRTYLDTLDFKKSSYTAYVGKKLKTGIQLSPNNANNKKISYVSSNPKYAKVNSKGEVICYKAGVNKTVTITAYSQDGTQLSTSCTIKIKMPAKTLKIMNAPKSLKAGKKVTLKVAATPSTASKSVKWSVNNKKYASITTKGVLTAKNAGKGKTVKVTAITPCGKKKTIKIRIK